MIKLTIKGLKEAQRQLKRFERSIPYAVRNTLNTMAFSAQREWRDEVKRTFTNRTPFTVRSLQVERATGRQVLGMRAVVGSIAPYMAVQEGGGLVHGRGAHKPIPQPLAAGQQGTRTRPVMAGRRLNRIKAAKARKSANRRQANAIALRLARKHGSKFALLARKSGGHGLFLISGGKRKLTTRMVWDLSKNSVRVPPAPTLERTMQKVKREARSVMAKALLAELKRNRLFGF